MALWSVTAGPDPNWRGIGERGGQPEAIGHGTESESESASESENRDRISVPG